MSKIEMTDKTIDEMLTEFGMNVTHIPTTTKDLNDLKLKYVVTILYQGRAFITTDYQMGVGHIPGYHLFGTGGPKTLHDFQTIQSILQSGAGSIDKRGGSVCLGLVSRPIRPDLKDVLYCLIQDGYAIDYLKFEEWAIEMGMHIDSRKAEAMFKECQRIGNTFRVVLGQTKLDELRNAYQDY